MKRELFAIGDYVHVFNRGNRKMAIFYDDNDRWRFLKILRYFNDVYSPENIFRKISEFHKFDTKQFSSEDYTWSWPSGWPEHNKLVKIISFCLMPNHFHLLLKETTEGGISKFMAKLGTGFTGYVNLKYKSTGRLFQGPYKNKTIEDMRYLQYLNIYIQLLNPFELYPGGFELARKEFDKAFEFTMNYRFGSLPDSFNKRNLGIIDKDVFGEMFPTLEKYKEVARDAILTKNIKESLGKSAID
ncbi:MAG: transposase [Patescibacteria group bacterium]|nr:transposase [Patescibacteria group bacterium]